MTHLRNQLFHQDLDFIDQVVPYFSPLESYFRYEVVGLEKIPEERTLVVMNHGVIPFHAFFLGKHMIEQREVYPRGLGAGFLFSLPLVREFLLKMGLVNANPKNAAKLLNQNHCVFLAPGGIYEALISHPGMKRIPWERRHGFVRLAVEAKASIVPTYCEGINEVYFNSQFLLRSRIKLLEALRFSVPLFYGLGLFPFPRKLVHFVGKPISTRKKKGESKEEQIRRVHHEVLQKMKDLQA